MSSLRNWVECPGPRVPELLADKIRFVANFPITDDEAMQFSIVLEKIVEELEVDNLSPVDFSRVTVIFTENGGFEFEDEGDNVALGLHFSLAVYAIGRIREKVAIQGEIVAFITFIEELVHHFWRLEDEVETKIKVTNIVNRIFERNFYITDLFSREWLNDELRRQGNQPRF
ncbi:hypothetical protein [Niallia sp. Krafla_26]|uniref:hypothetical protein n=1 Tax=Niallia sp. Krafla_26 TaxID=3064703 RepID=UPI003D181B61